MKKNFTLLSTAMLLVTSFQIEAQTTNALYPGVAAIDRTYMARKVSTPPAIDGDASDVAWSNTPWRQAASTTVIDGSWASPAGTPVAPEGAFDGTTNDIDVQYKIVWDDTHYYIIFRYKDDSIMYNDVHNGYRTGSVPAYASAVTGNSPAVGTGTGVAYQSFRMDQFAYWFTPYTATLEDGTLPYNRANNGLVHNFYPGQLTPLSTTPPDVNGLGPVLWAPKHNSVVNGDPQTHVGTVSGTVGGDGYIYIEFKDETWSNLFASVRTKSSVSGQNWYTGTVPVIGDKFILQGEVNDADGITNRRDYVNYFTHHDSGISALTNLKEALVVTLADADGTVLSVKSQIAPSSLNFYVDNSSVLRFNENVDIKIYNTVGQKVMESENSSEINISSLAKGVYIVKDKQGKSGKLIKD